MGKRSTSAVTIIEGEGWAFAFATQREAVRFRGRMGRPMLRTVLSLNAVECGAIGAVDSDGILDRTFGGIVHPARDQGVVRGNGSARS